MPIRTSSRCGVDLCEHCGGAFMEFFAGEPTALSIHLEPYIAAFVDLLRKPAAHPLTCPDCVRVMAPHPYLEIGPDIARCSRCFGMFATARQVYELSRLHLPPEDLGWPRWILQWMRRLAARLLGRATV